MSRKAIVLGFGVYYEDRWDGMTHSNGWLRTGSRIVHGIKTYPTLDEATAAVLADPLFGARFGHYQIVAEYAFFCRNGDECPECLSHEPVLDVDWSIVQEATRCGSS